MYYEFLNNTEYAEEMYLKSDVYRKLETLYHQTNKSVKKTQHLFRQLERELPNLDHNAVENKIEIKISTINGNCERLDILCLNGSESQPEFTTIRVDHLKNDSRDLAAALNSRRNQQFRKHQEQAEPEALLSQQFTTNDHVDILIDHNVQQQ